MVDLAHGVIFEILPGHLPINHFVNAATWKSDTANLTQGEFHDTQSKGCLARNWPRGER
jgi:hypothetical protein